MRKVAPNARIFNAYGATETPQIVSWCDVTERAIALGPGVDGAQLIVMDGDRRCAVGELGEIVVLSSYLARGYGQMYRSGDLGRLRVDGAIAYVGRADDQLNLRGFRVEPAEIERALLSASLLSAAFVDPELNAFVVGTGDDAALHRELRRRLPRYMLPRTITRLEAIPRTPRGKVDRAALPAVDHVLSDDRAPRGPIEQGVAALFGELLGAEEVGAGADFFALGGHSLLATQLLARVRRQFGCELPLRAVFEAPHRSHAGAAYR